MAEGPAGTNDIQEPVGYWKKMMKITSAAADDPYVSPKDRWGTLQEQPLADKRLTGKHRKARFALPEKTAGQSPA